jgi:hypothetical protein
VHDPAGQQAQTFSGLWIDDTDQSPAESLLDRAGPTVTVERAAELR